MNRVIKFRGKDCTGEWVYGNLEIIRDMCDGKEYESYRISTFHSRHGGSCEVVKETIGQYTGMRNTQSKEIYEGDVIRLENCGRGHYDAKVVWYKGNYIIVPDDDYIDEYSDELLSHYNSDCEIVGNIHDNPELLEC